MSLPTLAIRLPDRQERFCVLIVQGLSQTDAYLKAYNSTSNAVAAVNSSRMIRRAKIKDRIAQLREEIDAAQRVSLPFLTRGLLRAAGLAEGSGNPAAMAQAYLGVAKLHGFLIDRQQVDLMVRRPSPSPESPDEMTEEAWLAAHGPSITLEPESRAIVVPKYSQV